MVHWLSSKLDSLDRQQSELWYVQEALFLKENNLSRDRASARYFQREKQQTQPLQEKLSLPMPNQILSVVTEKAVQERKRYTKDTF